MYEDYYLTKLHCIGGPEHGQEFSLLTLLLANYRYKIYNRSICLPRWSTIFRLRHGKYI